MQALVRASGIPVVFEIDSSHPDIEQDVDLIGRTVRQSLDLFTELNPSYSWREQDGVVVVRPQTAWSDPHHRFNRSVTRLLWTDVTAGNVLKNVAELVWGFLPRGRQQQWVRAKRAPSTSTCRMVWFIGIIGPRFLVQDQESLGYQLFTEQGEYDEDPIGGMSGMSRFLKRRNERR